MCPPLLAESTSRKRPGAVVRHRRTIVLARTVYEAEMIGKGCVRAGRGDELLARTGESRQTRRRATRRRRERGDAHMRAERARTGATAGYGCHDVERMYLRAGERAGGRASVSPGALEGQRRGDEDGPFVDEHAAGLVQDRVLSASGQQSQPSAPDAPRKQSAPSQGRRRGDRTLSVQSSVGVAPEGRARVEPYGSKMVARAAG